MDAQTRNYRVKVTVSKFASVLLHLTCCPVYYILLLLLSTCFSAVHGIGDVIYAINAGGDAHVDSHGIQYQADPLAYTVGIASDYGKQLLIQRAQRQDQPLYQTERYNDQTFGYDIPIRRDGKYVLILKFCEVYFNSPNMKVFDVVLNAEHICISQLDIFGKVGRGVAHDEYIPFEVKNDRLSVGGQDLYFDGTLTVEFVKGDKDNPKINAVVVIAGNLDDVPKLPEQPNFDDIDEKPSREDEEEDSEEEEKRKKRRKTSGPKLQDPYAADDSSLMMPIVAAIGAFIPLLFCLCKL